MDIDVKVFGRLKCSESLLCLEGTSSCSEISFQFISFKEIMSKVFKKEFDFSDINSPQVYLWKEKIKHLKYYDIVQQFKHGAKSDLVNSELGLLNVICINKRYDFITKDHIKSCKELLEKIEEGFEIQCEDKTIFPELELIRSYSTEIKSILEKKGPKINYEDSNIIINNLSKIFNFVSYFKNEP